MSRIGGLLAKLALLVGLIFVVAWPVLATVLEATRAVDRLGAAFRQAGWIRSAKALATWQSSGFPIESGTPMNPAGTAEIVREDRGLARPIRLALETTGLVLATEFFAIPLGLLLAVLLFRTDLFGRRILLALFALAAFIPLPLHATAWLGALGNAGRMQAMGLPPILVGRFGAAVVHAIAALPWVILVAGVGLCSVEPELEESAMLEFGSLRVLSKVTFRRAIGSIAAAALAVAVLTAGDMTVTDLLQVRTYAEEAYVQFILGRGLADAAVVALPPMVFLGLMILIVGRSLSQLDPARLASSFSRARIWRLGGWRVTAGVLIMTLVGNIIAFPLYGLLWRAGRVGGRATLGRAPIWSVKGLSGTLVYASGEIARPLMASLFWAAIAATITTLIAFGLAWTSRRSRAWRTILLATIVVALATPGPIAGRALILAYRNWPTLYDSSAMVVIAQSFRALPYVLLVIWPFARSFPREYLESASLDGHGPWVQLFYVVLPLSLRALVAAWMVALALGLGELPATDQVCPPGIPPMSVFLWGLLHTGVDSHLAGVALVMLAVIGSAGLTAALALGRIRGMQDS